MSDAEIKASLPLQVLLYFHKPATIAFFIVNVLLFLYKGEYVRVAPVLLLSPSTVAQATSSRTPLRVSQLK